MTKAKDRAVRVADENYQWLVQKSEESQISIKSILDLSIKSLRGQPESALSLLFRDKKKR